MSPRRCEAHHDQEDWLDTRIAIAPYDGVGLTQTLPLAAGVLAAAVRCKDRAVGVRWGRPPIDAEVEALWSADRVALSAYS